MTELQLINRPVVCPILIGRTQDLANLQGLLDRAKSGQGRVALLCGEAGVGKSRLIAELKKYATSQNFLMLQGNCFQADQVFPYAPFLDLLRAYFSSSSPPANYQDATSLVQEISRFFPDAIALISQPVPPKILSSIDLQQEKRRLFALLLRFFTQLTAYSPLMIVMEDIHWSDDTSLELLVYLVRGCRYFPIQFVFSYRGEEVSPELRHTLVDFDREHLACEFCLQPLNRTDVDMMLHAIFSSKEGIHIGLSESIYQLTEGNPFFIEEVLKSLIATDEIINKAGNWEQTRLLGISAHHLSFSRGVQDAVYQRTKLLSPDARQVLTLAAVAGRRFDLTILQQVMQTDASRILALVKELVASQLVIEEDADRFSFRHALTRQAVYTELLISERKALHRCIAETMEQSVSASPLMDTRLVDLAYHYFEGGVWLKAAEYGQRAGERALNLYAPRAAIEHLTRALTGLKHLARTPTVSILRARGQAYETIGAFMQAKADYEQALSIALQDRAGQMEWQCLLDLGFLWAGHDYTQAGQWYKKSLDRARLLVDSKFHAHSLNRVGNWLVNTGQVEEGLQAHQQALTLFEMQNDTHGMAETFDLLGMAHGIYGDTMRAVEQYRRAIELFRGLGDHPRLISSLATFVVYTGPFFAETTYSACESFEHCSQCIMEASNLACQIDSQVSQAYIEWIAGGFFSSIGELGQGLSHAQKALQIATEIKHTQWMAGAYFTLGRIYILFLDATGAAQALKTGLQLASETGSAWWIGNITAYLVQALLMQGKVTQAKEVLQTALTEEHLPRNSPERRINWVRGELALAENEPEVALKIADRLLLSVPGEEQSQLIPRLLNLKGEALARLSRSEEALQALEEARMGAVARRERSLLWQIHRALGWQYQRLKKHEQAQSHFHSARQIIADLASTITDSPLGERFSRIALSTLPKEKPITASNAAKSSFGGLTVRERDVVRCIAQGKSNHEIAEELIVSKKTVETHINNILSKLNFISRAQIILWAIEKGLVKLPDRP